MSAPVPSDRSDAAGDTAQRSRVSWSWQRGWAYNGIVAVLYCLLAAASFPLREPASGIAPMWAPLGLAMFVLLNHGVRALPGVVSGVIGALVIVGLPLPIAVMHALGQVIAPCLGAWVLRRMVAVPAHLLERTDGAFKLLTIAYATAIFSAVATVAGLALEQGLPAAQWLDVGSAAWLGDALGIVVTMLPLLAWTTDRTPLLPLRRLVEQVVIISALLAVLWATFFGVAVLAEPMLQLYVALPLVIWVALRFSPKVGWTVFLVAALVALSGTVLGRSLLNEYSTHLQVLVLHGLITLTAATALFIGAAMFEKRDARRTLRERESHFRALTLLSADWHWELDADLRYPPPARSVDRRPFRRCRAQRLCAVGNCRRRGVDAALGPAASDAGAQRSLPRFPFPAT
jgi:integral membrane sensor domain MASE1